MTAAALMAGCARETEPEEPADNSPYDYYPPQYGINRAGLSYEALVEGAMNCYMSLIEDFAKSEIIGSKDA